MSLLVIIPLFFLLNFSTIFTAPKLLYLRGVSVSVSLILILQFFFQRKFQVKVPVFAKNFLPWLLSLIISTIFTINIFTSIYGQFGRYTGLITLLNFLILPFLFWQYFEKKDLPKLLLVSLSTAVLAALYGILQHFAFFGLFSWGVNWSDSPQIRIFGTVGHADHLGAYLAANLLILLFIEFPIFTSKTSAAAQKYFQIILKLTLGLILISAIILTASRGALLAFLLSALIFTLFYLHLKKTSKPQSKKPIITKFIIILIILLTVFFSISTYFKNKNPGLELFIRDQATVSSIEKGYIPERLSFAFSALEMFSKYPIFGTGLSTFRDAYNHFRRPDYMINGPGNLQYITVPEAAHNEYLNILATQGLFGLLAYLWLLGAASWLFYRSLKNTKNQSEQKILLAIFGALSVYLIQTLFNFGEIVNLTVFYFSLAAIGFYSPIIKLKFLNNRSRIRFLIAPIFIIFLLYFSYSQIYQVAIAETSLKSAQNNKNTSNYQVIEHNFSTAIQAMPNEYILHQDFANFLLTKSASDSNFIQKQNYLNTAIHNYLSALKLNNYYSSTYNNLALAYFSLFDLTHNLKYKTLGKEAMYNAVQKGHNNPRYLYEYARKLYIYFNNKKDAIKYLKKALQINPNYQEPQDYLNFIHTST